MTVPFKSRAQQGFMHAAAERGYIPKSVVKDFDKATTEKQFEQIPEHVKKAHGGVIPDGYEITAEGDKHFDVTGPRGSFQVAKRGLGRRTADELHQHFAKGGRVQKLADGDEVQPSTTGDPETDRMLAVASGQPASQGDAPVFTGDSATDQLIADQSIQPAVSRVWGRTGFQPLAEPAPEPVPLEGDEALRADMARRGAELEARVSSDRAAGLQVAPPVQPIEEPATSPEDLGGTITPPTPMRKTITPEAAMREVEAAKRAQQGPVPARAPSGGGGGGGGALEAGFEAQKQANLAQAKIAKDEADALSLVQQDLAARGDQIRKDFEARLAKNENLAEITRQKISDAEIDPRQFWAKKDTGARIQAGIAVALGGFAAGLRGDGRNSAVEIINKAIDRDIDAQKANLGKQETLLSFYVQQGNSLMQAENMARAHLMDVAGEQTRMVATKYAGPKALANAELVNGALSVQAKELRARMAAIGSENALRGLQVDQAKLGLQVAKQHQQWIAEGAASPEVQADPRWAATGALQGWIPAGTGETLAVPAVGIVQVKNVTTGKTEDRPVMQQVQAADKAGAAKIRESTAGTMDALLSIDALANSWKKLGPIDVLSPVNTNKESAFDAQKVAVIGKMRLPLTGPGILTDNEVERIMKALPSRFDWSGRGEAKLESIKENIIAANRAVVQAYALPPGQERVTVLKKARSSLLALAK